jgi:quinol-cytochrome oxidoreductase complex cytochrome b subunit
LLLIAYFYDAPLKEMANPSVPENPAKSPWYFLGLQELVSYSAFAGGIAIPFMLIVALISIPFLDREDTDFGSWFAGRAGKRVTLNSLIYALVITLGIIAFTIQAGWIRDWFDSPPPFIVILFNPATVLTFVYMAWAFYILRKTASTRMSALALFSCCLVGFIILTVLGMWFRGPDWQFFWLPSQWPPH